MVDGIVALALWLFLLPGHGLKDAVCVSSLLTATAHAVAQVLNYLGTNPSTSIIQIDPGQQKYFSAGNDWTALGMLTSA